MGRGCDRRQRRDCRKTGADVGHPAPRRPKGPWPFPPASRRAGLQAQPDHRAHHRDHGNYWPVPNVAGVVAALDHVYRCDGRLGIDQVFDSIAQQASADNQFTVRFPGYYVGPTWIHATGRNANDIGVVDLIWGPWRRQRIRSGMLITTRKALADGPPLIVAIPPGWRVVVGIGAAPTAADINHGWHPVSIRQRSGCCATVSQPSVAHKKSPTLTSNAGYRRQSSPTDQMLGFCTYHRTAPWRSGW
jgi:hypothetical protein